jgi:sortase A
VSRTRVAVRTTGELLITAGLVVLLFAGYQLFWTNVEAQVATDRVTDQIRADWDLVQPNGDGSPSVSIPPFDQGRGFAFLRIPRLGSDFSVPVVQGIDDRSLKKGVGHYPETALPGAVGNFAVAGHRATNGEPFRDLDLVRPGDPLVVETAQTWYVYRVSETKIVEPTRVSVLLPVPEEPGVAASQALITLTTCHPRWASYQRLIVHGELVETLQKPGGPPTALTDGG